MTAPSTFKFALACGAAGAYVEVTSDVLFEEGSIPFNDGRISMFDGFVPGTFSFTLKNGDGKYTPDNPDTTLVTPVTEGMGVSIELGGLLFSGTIRNTALIFPPRERAATARVRITCDDALGDPARTEFDTLMQGTTLGSTPYLYWPFNDAVNSFAAAESSGLPNLALYSVPDSGRSLFDTYGAPTFGVAGIEGVGGTQAGPVGGLSTNTGSGNLTTSVYETDSMGAWGFWATHTRLPADGQYVTLDITSLVGDLIINSSFGTWRVAGSIAGAGIIGPSVPLNTPQFVAVTVTGVLAAGTWTLTVTLYIDGVASGSSTSSVSATNFVDAKKNPSLITFVGAATVSHLSHTAELVHGEYLTDFTEAGLIAALAQAAGNITLDTLPADLSTALVRLDTGGLVLAKLNDVMRTERGYLWAETTGTLLAPVQKIKVASRNRERAVDYTFDVSEILDPIPFVRSLANTVSQATADGPDGSVSYRNPALVPIVGPASTSDTVLFTDPVDLYSFASDRIVQGIVTGYPITSITIDATSPQISRWADLTTIRQGYRLHITGLPETQLGYDTWDGFVVGREIMNTQDSQTDEPKTFFTFYLSPWSPVAVYDTARYMAAGALTLSAAIATAGATSMSVATSTSLAKITTTNLPITMIIDGEEITVTACDSATPQNATITRGVNGTTATTHAAGALVEMATESVYAL